MIVFDDMKKILVISQYFYPEQFRINDICENWVKRGYDVTVLTGIPNYPEGKFYKGYSWFKKNKEIYKGIKIIRIPLIPRGHSKIGLVLNYFSFPISGFLWNIFTKIKADCVFMFETSPMTQCKIGVRYRKKHKVPLYLYVQDLWPENVEIVTGITNPIIINPINRMVDNIYKACDHIFVTSPSFVEAVVNRKKKVPRDKIHYWPQYAEDFYIPISSEDAYSKFKNIKKDNSFKIAFTGNIGYAQGLDILPRTAELLRDYDIKFVIVGDGRYKEKLLEEISAKKVEDKFVFIDRQKPQDIPYVLGCCDAGFISFMKTDLFTKTIPAKLQSYLACGIPIIAAAEGETKRIVAEADCGVCVPIGDADSLSIKIKDIIPNKTEFKEIKGKNARNYFEKNFTRKQLLDDFEKYLGK